MVDGFFRGRQAEGLRRLGYAPVGGFGANLGRTSEGGKKLWGRRGLVAPYARIELYKIMCCFSRNNTYDGYVLLYVRKGLTPMNATPRFLSKVQIGHSWSAVIAPRIHRAMVDGTVPVDGLSRAAFVERVLFDIPVQHADRTLHWLAKKGTLRLVRDRGAVRVLQPAAHRRPGRPPIVKSGFNPVINKEQVALVAALAPLLAKLRVARQVKGSLAERAAAREDAETAALAIRRRMARADWESAVEVVSLLWPDLPELLRRPPIPEAKRLPNNAPLEDRVMKYLKRVGRAGAPRSELLLRATTRGVVADLADVLSDLLMEGKINAAKVRRPGAQRGLAATRYFDAALGPVREHRGHAVFDRPLDPLPERAPTAGLPARLSGAATEPVRSPSSGTNHKPVPWKPESSTASPSGATKRPSSPGSAPWKGTASR